MSQIVEIELEPESLDDDELIKSKVRSALSSPDDFKYRIIKRSLDARSRPVYKLKVEVLNSTAEFATTPEVNYSKVHQSSAVHIVGAGPAGLFAALKCIEKGLKPILFERGKDVRSRRRDLAKLNREHIVDPESNYCFGEGGAGAYSDGKLYTRSKKRGSVQSVLNKLVEHGASPDILVNAHPHIGTNKLPGIITAIRETIESFGGEVRFNSKLTDIEVEDGRLRGIEINGKTQLESNYLILATGHSARDIFSLLPKKNIRIESKPFALGVRVEHPQELIDKVRYGRYCSDILPPAAYSLTAQVHGRGVYSFCMCPGGIIAPCATEPGEVVTNGWSPSKRNNPFANSGVVVEVREEDLVEFEQEGELRGIEFQRSVEKSAWIVGGKRQTAPAQRLMDFINGKSSVDLPSCSYHPGIISADLSQVLPEQIHQCLQDGLKVFGKKMKSYLSNEAVVVATESRTSSPVRIPRDRSTLEHVEVGGLYPCGEGAGYAGGIVSAAIDGERCVEAIHERLNQGHS